jgi:hypothetical protein
MTETSEVSPRKIFKIDLARLPKDDLEMLRPDKLAESRPKSVERFLMSSAFLTPEEHRWIGSSTEFQYPYPITPLALIYFPNEIDKINQMRKKLGDTECPARYLVPNIRKAGYFAAYLSLEEIDPQTGERKKIPEVTRLLSADHTEIRDPEILKQFTYNPRAFKEEVIADLDRKIKSAESQELRDLFQKRKDVFSQY